MNKLMPAAVFLSGAGIALTLSPFYLWLLVFPLLAFFAWRLFLCETAKQAFRCGWLFGFGLNLASVSWVFVSINEHSNTPFVLSLLLTLLFCAFLGSLYGLFAWIYFRLGEKNTLSLLLGFPSIMVLQEFFKGWFLTGFPWPFIGYSQTESWLLAYAPLFGVNGLSFICCFIAALLAWCFISRKKSSLLISCISILVIFSGGFALTKVNWVTATDKSTTVSLVQANIPQEKKWQPGFLQETINRYMTLSQLEWNKGGLVIWPESAMATLYVQAQQSFERIAEYADQHQGGFMSGVLTHKLNDDDSVDYFNSIMGFAGAEGIYNKRHLVPFGEVVPFEDYLQTLGSIFALPMSSFSRGEKQQQPLVFNGIRFSPYICYEIIFPRYIIRDFENTDVLLTISNDTWFGNSHGPWQHVQMARMRAVEAARYLVRANNNGFSVIVDHKGNILKQSRSFEQDVISDRVQVMTGKTPFMILGQWPVFGFCLLACLLMIYRKKSATG